MEFVQTYGKELVSVLVPFITWYLNVGVKAKAKLIWASPHSFTFLIQEPLLDRAGAVLQPSQKACTASVRVVNVGRETATKVELVFNWRPHYLNIWPVRHYEQKTDQDGRHILIFDNLAPKEEIGLEIMSINADLPAMIAARSAECTAKNISMAWVPQLAPWKINVVRTLIFIGLSTSLYWVITLLQFLILRTPF